MSTPILPNDSEFVTVKIGEQQFAIDIMTVREIRGWSASTPLPHAQPWVLGMINLRGAILPVIDLGARLGRGPSTPTASSVIVVADVADQQLGLLVDEVCDIVQIGDGALQEAPRVGAEDARRYVSGLLTTAAGIITLLSLDPMIEDAPQLAA